jgi:PhzF family phenazine biosynthesis protein
MTVARFSIVDVFSSTPFKGNPLAVVHDVSSTLTDTQMQLIARQFNLSETTFVSKPTVPCATYRLRSFLPNGKEVFGAGHNSLGAWWWLAKNGFLELSSKAGSETEDNSFLFHQQLAQDVLPVNVQKPADSELAVSLRQLPPQFYGVHSNPAALAGFLGIDAADIGFEFAGQKIVRAQVVSTSSSRHLLIPVASVAALNSVTFADKERLTRELQSVDELAYGLYLFTPSPGSADGSELPTFQARFFSPGMSGEDPATGSAAGPLAGYLHNYGALTVVAGGVGKLLVLQGLQVGRTCLLTLSVAKEEGAENVSISISGTGVEVATGSVAVPGLDMKF